VREGEGGVSEERFEDSPDHQAVVASYRRDLLAMLEASIERIRNVDTLDGLYAARRNLVDNMHDRSLMVLRATTEARHRFTQRQKRNHET
jgi:hypothetical protein